MLGSNSMTHASHGQHCQCQYRHTSYAPPAHPPPPYACAPTAASVTAAPVTPPQWSEGDVWRGRADLPLDTPVSLKYIQVDGGGGLVAWGQDVAGGSNIGLLVSPSQEVMSGLALTVDPPEAAGAGCWGGSWGGLVCVCQTNLHCVLVGEGYQGGWVVERDRTRQGVSAGGGVAQGACLSSRIVEPHCRVSVASGGGCVNSAKPCCTCVLAACPPPAPLPLPYTHPITPPRRAPWRPLPGRSPRHSSHPARVSSSLQGDRAPAAGGGRRGGSSSSSSRCP